VDASLGFLGRLVEERAQRILTRLEAKRGRGSTFAAAFSTVCEDLIAQGQAAQSGASPTGKDFEVAVREMLRTLQQLDILYSVVAHFEADVGRRDLPVGLLYLVDELVKDLLPQSADPLIHLDDRHMYSTLPILETLPGLLKPDTVTGIHPVAFNLPGLDPNNAMLAPILAHEVGHTSWRQGIASELDQETDQAAVKGALDIAVSKGVDASELTKMYASWGQELMCDVLAATLTGPSFLFASGVFLPGPGHAVLGTHPYPQDRVALTLRILERFDWIECIERQAPKTLQWFVDLAGRPELSGHPAETALRDSMSLIEPALLKVAENLCTKRLTASAFVERETELADFHRLQIPPAVLSGEASSPWLIICSTWMNEIVRFGDDPVALPRIAVDDRANRFSLKAVELAAIASCWGEDEPASA